MHLISHIQAITLDLDDTLWPVAPTIAGAEQDLLEWLCVHSPQTADLTRQIEVKKTIRQQVICPPRADTCGKGRTRKDPCPSLIKMRTPSAWVFTTKSGR
ncbi:MAG: hypothetical protein NT095_07735, partial [Burkholderiales bacterium]|nr:hypothetical protein [Burkholderiales bacterium]